MKLFDLAPAYEKALAIIEQMEQDGCSADEVAEAMRMVDQIEGDLNTKCLNIASWVRNLESEAKAIKEAQDAMDKRRKAAVAQAERLRNYLFHGMKLAGVSKIPFPHFVISLRECPESVQIAPGALIPNKYLKFSDPEPNKVSIKEALKAGTEIPGCSLARSMKLEIK